MQIKNINSTDIKFLFASAILLSITVFIFTPLLIYTANLVEFLIPPHNLLIYSFCFSLAFFVFLAGIGFCLKNEILKKYISLLLGLSLLVWIQSNILVWDYGRFDGHFIRWNDHIVKIAIDSLLWLAVIYVFFLYHDIVLKKIKKIIIGLLLIQMMASLFNIYHVKNDLMNKMDSKNYVLLQDNMFVFSPEKNVIIMILDMFNSFLFQDIIDSEPRLESEFAGFTYYRNSLSGYLETSHSIPNIVSGKFIEPGQYDQSVKRLFKNDSIMKILKENGFIVDFQTLIPRCIYVDDKIVSNYELEKTHGNEFRRLCYFSFFRFLPSSMKFILFRNMDTFLEEKRGDNTIPYDFIFFDEMEEKISVCSDRSCFKFYHRMGGHFELLYDENLNITHLPFTRDGRVRQAKGLMKLVKKFLTRLEEKGIYDNTLIFIIGDHGRTSLGNPDYPSKYQKISQMQAMAIPLFLVKPFNARNTMRISDAPVCLSDIKITILDELNIPHEMSEKSVFERNIFKIKEDEKRVRIVCDNYTSESTFYEVEGLSYQESAWIPTEEDDIVKELKTFEFDGSEISQNAIAIDSNIVENIPLSNFSYSITSPVIDIVGTPDEIIKIPVTVCNRSNESFPENTWPSAGKKAVYLSYHLYGMRNNIQIRKIYNGYRTRLPLDLKPGKSVDLIASVLIPNAPGDYIIQFTMLQEDVAWFDSTTPKESACYVNLQVKNSIN